MKLKADVQVGCPPELVEALNNVRNRVVQNVLVPHLKVDPQIGPAEFYVQECDFASAEAGGLCEVRLTGVSQTNDRAVNDFFGARDALEAIYIRAIQTYLPHGESMQLFVVVMIDKPLPDGTNLVESVPKKLMGSLVRD